MARISNGHLSNLEQGKRRPSIAVAHRLVYTLQLDETTATALIDEAAPLDRKTDPATNPPHSPTPHPSPGDRRNRTTDPLSLL